ncbi:MAG: tyrosine-protein phosphatase [Alphaproteobacteria bacterium]
MRALTLTNIALTILFCFVTEASANPCKTDLQIDLPKDCASIEILHPIEGLQNFRAVSTPDNGIKENTLYRSDQLDELTDADIQKLVDLGLVTVVDLRAHEELESHPNKQIPSVQFTVNLPIGSDPADVAKIMPVEVASQIRPLWFEGKFHEIDGLLTDNGVDLYQIRINRYKDFARDFNPQISRYMHALTNESNFPLLFHCAGGKDRTGYVAAVTLLTLGYNEEDVVRDYLTTNIFTFNELSGLYSKGPQSLRPAFGAHIEQIEASLQAIKEDYGDFETYRRDALGISDEEAEKIKINLLIHSP